MKITASRRTYEVSNKDLVMYNGACYQLMTQKYYHNWGYISPVISKTNAKKWIKEGILVFEKKKDYIEVEVEWYRFNVDKQEG